MWLQIVAVGVILALFQLFAYFLTIAHPGRYDFFFMSFFDSKKYYDTSLSPSQFYLALDPGRRKNSRFDLFFLSDACRGYFTIYIKGCMLNNSSTLPTEYAHASGPDSFQIRIAGPESVALQPADIRMYAPCRYNSSVFNLHTAGRYKVQIWHLYENFTGLKFSDIERPQVLPEYMELETMEFEGKLRPSSHQTEIICRKSNGFRGNGESAVINSTRPFNVSCNSINLSHGRWIQKNITSNYFGLLDYEPMVYNPHVVESQRLAYIPDNCELQRRVSQKWLECLYEGGVGSVERLNKTGRSTRKILIVGDSHFRTVTNGFWFAFSDDKNENSTLYHLPDIHRLIDGNATFSNMVHIEYCEFYRPFWKELVRCSPNRLNGPDDIVIIGSSAWPLSAIFGGTMQPKDYKHHVSGSFMALWQSWASVSPQRRVIWLSSVAQTMYISVWLRENIDHRNNFLYSLYNNIAREIFTNTRIEFVDIYSICLPVNNLSMDRSHYDSAVLREIINVLLNILTNDCQIK